MATTASAYGLRPVNLIGGQPYAGSTQQIKIASGYAVNIFYGSVVHVTAAGVLELVTDLGNNADAFPAGTVGVFMGCQYTDSVSGLRNQQYWPASQVAADAVGYVVTDPSVVFQVQADATLPQTALGINIPLANVQSTSTGSTQSGNSNVAVDASAIAVTATIGFKIIGFVDGPLSTVGDAYTDVLVKFNPSSHAYLAGLGI